MFKGNLIATARPKTLASSAQEHILYAGTRFKRQCRLFLCWPTEINLP